jgi:RNA polymerase sigma factor (sigma-70 family)
MDHQKIKANRERIDVSVRLIYRQDTLNIAFDKLSSDELVRMLDLLQPRQREILHLHIIGYRNEEIAEKLGITYNTVKNNIYEARLRLRKLWAVFME